ncbi:hypothetical protein Tco_1289204, partial [Tanacetum coccineum]
MTGNKAYLSEYEDFNGGFMAFGSDPKGGEESEDQGRKFQDIDDDPLVSLVRKSMKEKSTDFVTPTKSSREAHEEEISPTILEAAKTLSKTVKIEDASEKAMCAIDGAGFDWSDMAEEEIQANMVLMAFSDSE